MLRNLGLTDQFGVTIRGIIVASVLFFLAIMVPVTYVMFKQAAACEAAGGEMVGTGRYTMIAQKVGNSTIMTQHEIKECSVPA